jgi:hypothetical protein
MNCFTFKKLGRTLVKMTAMLTLVVGVSAAGVKNVAVVETAVDAQSGASDGISPAEVKEITAELRRQASQNLPSDRYSVMTAATVQSADGGVSDECADEKCAVALGKSIGADYIVRGSISKFQTRFILAVEMYETENGTLAASSEAVRSENIGELLDKATTACAAMFKKFADGQKNAQESAASETALSVNLNGAAGGGESGEREHGTYSYSVLKYKFPIKTNVKWGGVNVEYGKIRDDGYFSAFDFGWAVGWNADDDDLEIDALGIGKTYGYALDLPENLRLIVGGSVGIWFSRSHTSFSDVSKGTSGGVSTMAFDFFGPTAKIQWKFLELSYRWLLGYYTVDGSITAGSGSYKTTTDLDDNGFGYKRHQLALGFCAREELTKSWDYGEYSFADRFGTAAMNWTIPGLGSMVVMHNYRWGISILGSIVGGITCNIIASDLGVDDDDIGYSESEKKSRRATSATLGAIGTTALVVGLLANAAHPWIAGLKSPAKTASHPADGFKFAAYPKDGELKYVGAYTKSY